MLSFFYGTIAVTLPFPCVVLKVIIPPQVKYFEFLVELYFFLKKIQIIISGFQNILNSSFVLTLLALPLHLVLSVNSITLLIPSSPVARPGTERSCCGHSDINLSGPALSL